MSDDASRVHAQDQAGKAAHDLGALRAQYYRGCVSGGMPRWLAAVVTIIHTIGSDVLTCDCDEEED